MENRKNQGFSLIELIVVVVMIGILSGVTVASISTIRAGDAIGFAKNLTTSLERARLESLSKPKDSIVAELSKKEDGYYMTYYYQNGGTRTEVNSIRLGSAGLSVVIVKEDDSEATVGTQPTEINKVEFRYSKSTGAFLDGIYKAIKITGRNNVVIKMVKETGRCFIQ